MLGLGKMAANSKEFISLNPYGPWLVRGPLADPDLDPSLDPDPPTDMNSRKGRMGPTQCGMYHLLGIMGCREWEHTVTVPKPWSGYLLRYRLRGREGGFFFFDVVECCREV